MAQFGAILFSSLHLYVMRRLLPRSHPEEDRVCCNATPFMPVPTPTANLNRAFDLMLGTRALNDQ